jgi:hypothetical protein
MQTLESWKKQFLFRNFAKKGQKSIFYSNFEIFLIVEIHKLNVCAYLTRLIK